MDATACLKLARKVVYSCRKRFPVIVGRIPWDDAVSVACISILKAEQSFDSSTGFQLSTYACKVATNDLAREGRYYASAVTLPSTFRDTRYCTTARYKETMSRLLDQGSLTDEAIGRSPDTTSLVIESERLGLAAKAWGMLSRLPLKQRTILKLFFSGCSYREIGKRLGVNRKSASKAADAGIERLRRMMNVAHQ